MTEESPQQRPRRCKVSTATGTWEGVVQWPPAPGKTVAMTDAVCLTDEADEPEVHPERVVHDVMLIIALAP